jgi:hypothetical protein
LLDAELLENFMRYDHEINSSAWLCILTEINSGRLDAQPAEVNAPVDDGLIYSRIFDEDRLALWDAINEYTVACRGQPDRFVYGNTTRMNAVSKVEQICRRMLTRPTSQWIPDWRPIETAPKDGTVLLSLWGDDPQFIAWINFKDEEGWRVLMPPARGVGWGIHGNFAPYEPKVWMPIPPTRPGEEV